MNLREIILQEHSKKQCQKIVAWVDDDKKRFAELIYLMLNDEYRVAQRAAYPVSYCVRKHPELIKPWFGKMVKKMSDKKAHDAVRRNALRILEDVNIPEKYCGELFEISNQYLHNLKEPIAVRAFSISVMCNIAKKFPELKTEVKLNAESLLQCGIPALEARGRNVLKELSK
ncbi:MAG TPA: hypothetical protein VNZ49_17390 [Bacteroidia bacterium]|jgi:hypothetical protein|nr:hypothetical protein [Bacteroidia bacterium]